MQQNYNKLVSDTIAMFPIGKPIFTDDVAYDIAQKIGADIDKCKQIVNLNLKRLADANKINRYQKGVYYKTVKTVFGEVKPTTEIVITEMATRQNKRVIGYITGDAFLHQLGLISLLPKEKEIVTNKYRAKIDSKANVKLRKPTVTITDDNYRYLQLLDAINCLENSYIDAENPVKILREFETKENLDKLELLTLAKKHYPKKTLDKALDIILEV